MDNTNRNSCEKNGREHYGFENDARDVEEGRPERPDGDDEQTESGNDSQIITDPSNFGEDNAADKKGRLDHIETKMKERADLEEQPIATKEAGSTKVISEEKENVNSDPSTDETASLTPDLAPVPQPPSAIARRRLQSNPGAFRIRLFGHYSTSEDDDSNVGSTTDDGSRIPAGAEANILVEATLVTDQAVTDERGDSEDTVPEQSNVALVEAKPLRQRSIVCRIIGSWKALCFVVLVIIVIASISMLIQKNNQGSPRVSTVENPSNINGTTTLQPTEPKIMPDAPSVSISLQPIAKPSLSPTSFLTLISTAEPSLSPSTAPSTAEPSLSPSTAPSTAPSDSPSIAPTSIVFEDLIELPNTTRHALQNPRSPQSLALHWLKDDPQLDDYSAQQRLQRFALATFYLSTNGEFWARQDYWLSYNHTECDWYSDEPKATVCTNGTYEVLSVSSFGKNLLSGTIPDELYFLTGLVALELYSDNELRGTISDMVSNLTKLQELELFDLSLTGSIPASVAALTELTSLRLQGNALVSTIPAELGNLSSLLYLYLGDNKLTGSFPETFGELASLTELVAPANLLTGSLPLMASLNSLEMIYLQNNRLNGSIPESIANCTHLSLIELGSNSLSGTLPSEIGLLRNLETIDLYNNTLTGGIPTEWGSLGNISTLFLDSNNLNSTIPSSLGLLTNLSVLWLHNNYFHGIVPDELCSLTMNNTVEISIDCLKVSCSCACTCSRSSDVASTKEPNNLH